MSGENPFNPEEEYRRGTSDRPKSGTGKEYTPLEEIKDTENLNPEEALLAKEEYVEENETEINTDPKKYWAENKSTKNNPLEKNEEDLSDLEEMPEKDNKFDDRKYNMGLRYDHDSNKNRASYGTEQKPIYKEKRKGFGATIKNWFQR